MSEIIFPSFSRKLSWAEKHLHQLENDVQQFRDRHPYRTRKVARGRNRGAWVIEFTERPNPIWALMVGDALYNLRSCLDHLACALNPPSVRSHVMFPITHEPIWNDVDIGADDSEERTRLREKWEVSTRHMHDEAVEVIKRLQPTSNDHEPFFHCLDLLNRLSNKDRHRTLVIHLTGLIEITVQYGSTDGFVYSVTSAPDVPAGMPGTAALQDGATIQLPPQVDPSSIVDVMIRGCTTQAISMGQDGRQVVIPDSLRQILEWIRDQAVVPLSPFLHGPRLGV
jgi:hypothetical protein